MKKKMLIIWLLAMFTIVLIGLTGCGNNKKTDENNNTEKISKVGNLSLEVQNVGDFSEGLATVKKDGKWGYIDKSGNIVIDCIYDDAKSFSEGLAPVEKDGKYGFINTKGETVVEQKYRETYNFEFGYAVVRQNSYYGVIDKNGIEIIKPDKYTGNIVVVSDGLFFVPGPNGGYDIIDKDSNVIIDGIANAGKYSNGLIPVKEIASGTQNPMQNGKWAYIDEKGNKVIDYIYDFAGSFVDGIAGVVYDGKIGYINTKGEYVIEPQYTYSDKVILRDYSCGIVSIYDGEKSIYFDENGNKLFDSNNGYSSFSEDFVKCEKDDQYGYMNKEGKLVIDYKYYYASDFSNGLALVYKDKENFEFINNNGKTILAGKILK